jgi:uncharacterized protein YkwD
MTDMNKGMEGSKHRYISAARTAIAGALLVGVVAVAGCGGGGGGSDKPAPPPTPAGGAGAGGVVGVEGTQGLVGPADRSTSKGSQTIEKQSKIPGNANHVPKKNGHAVAGAADCHGDVTPTADNLPQMNDAILCLVNAMRAENGNLPPLSSNPQLAQAASGMAQRMVTEHFFSHETPDGKNVVDRVEPTGYIPDSGDWVVGENLAWGSGALSTPQAIVNGWMNSPGHRANILANDYKDIGLAAAMGSPSPDQSGGTVYVNNFGAKSGADTNATLPGHEGGEGSDSGSGEAAAATAGAAGGSQAVAAKKAKAKKKAKRKHRRKKKKRH